MRQARRCRRTTQLCLTTTILDLARDVRSLTSTAAVRMLFVLFVTGPRVCDDVSTRDAVSRDVEVRLVFVDGCVRSTSS